MCLAVPGRIVALTSEAPMGSTREATGEAHGTHPVETALWNLPRSSAPTPAPEPPADPNLWRMATVDFGGVRQPVSLACLPEARLGDLVLVHVGLAICRVEESLLEPIVKSMALGLVDPTEESMAPQLLEPMVERTEEATLGSPAAAPEPIPQRSPPPMTVPVRADRRESDP